MEGAGSVDSSSLGGVHYNETSVRENNRKFHKMDSECLSDMV